MVSHAKTCEEDPTELMSTCEFKCAAHYADLAQKAYDKECYHLAIWAGEQSSANLDKLGELYKIFMFGPESIIGRSNYELGSNYSATLTSLKCAIQHTSIAIRSEPFSVELRELRSQLCFKVIATVGCLAAYYTIGEQ